MTHTYPNEQRLSFRSLATLTAFGLLAACATGGRGPGPSDAGAVKPDEQPKVVAEADKHRVAVLVPTTGPNAALGQSIANAANMALLDSGNQRIRLTIYNTAGGATGAAQRAIADGNRLFLGPLLSPDVKAVQGVASAAKVPVLSFSNDAELAGNGTYVLGFQVDQSIDRVVRYAKSQGVERFAALVPAGTYGQRASSAMIRAVESADGRLTSIATYSRDTKSLTAAVRKLTGSAGPAVRAQVREDGTVARTAQAASSVPFEAVLIADSGKIALAAMPLLQRGGASGSRVLGTELWRNEPGLARVNAMHGAWFAAVPDGVFKQFSNRYRERFGGTPYRLSSLGYDSVLLVNRIATKWKTGGAFPQAALHDAGGFAGVDGAFRFNQSGIAVRGLEVNEVRSSGFAVLSAAPTKF